MMLEIGLRYQPRICGLPATPGSKSGLRKDAVAVCRKRVNRLPDVAAVIRVANGYAVGEDRP